MLCFTRKEKQSFYVGDTKVTVRYVTGNKVAIGVEADRDVPVHRTEVRERLAAEAGPRNCREDVSC